MVFTSRLSLSCKLLTLAPLFLYSACAQTTGSFDFLTYNIAGLPDFINDNGVPGDKATNARTIGSKLTERAYDIVHLQEDFNYHSQVYSTDKHPYRTKTSGGVPFGSGLNTVANYNWNLFKRVTWKKCDVNVGDCLTPKGFSLMRVVLAPGAEVDFYNLHADAGDKQGDIDARRSGVEQVLAYINQNSAGRAIIIGGDSNDRWTNSQLSINLLTQAGFADPWVDIIKGGQYPTPGSPGNGCDIPAASNDCEVVDKVFYRSGTSLALSATSWNYESNFFLQPDGNRLSDHNPVHVEFAWSTA